MPHLDSRHLARFCLLRLAPCLLAAVLVTHTPAVAAQEANDESHGRSLQLMIGDTGLGIGHVPRITGLRVNWSDQHLERVTGVNLTLWRARPEGVGGQIRGLALGLAPQAGHLAGVGAGLGAVVGEESLTGLHAAGLASIAGESTRGIQLAGLAAISGEDTRGIQLGGLAAISGEDTRGIQLGGLAAISGEDARGVQAGGMAMIGGGNVRGLQAGGMAVVAGNELRGAQAAGLAVVGGGAMHGIQAAGLATVAGGNARGLQVGGLAVVAGGRMDGVQVGGIAVVSGCSMRGVQLSLGSVETNRADQRFGIPEAECPARGTTGLTAGGFRVVTPEARGITGAVGWISADEIRGLSAAGLQRSGLHVGLSVGLINWTDHLRGVQLGLLNRAGNNPAPFRVLPLLNVSL